MQHNRVRMGSKGNEYDENCCENASSQYSINEADALPLVKSSECENQQQAANGITNQVSVSSSHDSVTQSAESKSVTRFSNVTDPSEEVAVLQKLISVGTVGKDQSSHNPQCEKGSCIGDSRGVDGHDDHTSCVSTSKNSSLVHDSLNRNIDMKNISCISISDGSKAATASLDEQSSEKYICGNSVMPGGCADSSIQKVRPSLSIDISSHELESIETPLQENVDAVASSFKVQASHCNSNVMSLEENELLQPLEKLPEFSNEHMNSSAKERELDIPHGQKSAACEDNKNGLIGKGSKVTGDIPPKSKLEMTEEVEDQLDATAKSFGQTEHVDKLELVEFDGVQESPLESPSGDETGESDIVEQDVKVCDICGDAGREDLLAVCCRCSDGAEHTYCMRKMLKKVPEGEWLCEECKFAEESESQSQFEADGESENASSQSSGQSINGLSLKPDPKGSKAYAKATSKISSGHKLSGKRALENLETGSTMKRQALEAGIGSPKPSPNRVSAISRDSSFRSIEKGKLKSVHQTSNGTHSSNYIAERARSPSNNAHPQISRGALLKSHSFSPGSLKPKIKLVDDVPLKQIGARDHASLGMKDGAVRSLGKSMSFKPTNSGRSNGIESKVKIFPPKISQDQDFKHAKDHKVFERKKLPKLGRPLFSSTKISSAVSTPKGYHKPTSRGESSLSPISNNRDMKVSQSDGKVTSLSRSTSNLGRKGTETTGVSGGVSCAEQKSNQLSYKEEPSSSNANGGLQDGFPRLQESANQADKAKESFIGRSRQTVTNGVRMAACQKCKEVGHEAESCTVAAPHASGINVSSARISRDEMKEGNTLKDAITAAALKKPGIYKKKLANKVEQRSASNTDRSVGLASQDKSSVPSTLRNATSAKGIHDGQAVLQSSMLDSCRPMIVENMEQTASNPRKAADSLMAGDADSIMASNGKPTAREVSSYISAAMAVCKTIAIPEHEYIWQGNFELHRGGKEPELCAGIQAHVSTSASRKVVEVMNKFPLSVSFNEVPRLSTWPRQFHGSGAKEENIALYFFAKDLESYQRNYEWLVERMIKNDLALKGNLDGAEILVFPSNQLPEKSQRWNMLFFLWAVFKGKKANGSDHTPSSNKLDIPSLNIPPVDKDISGTLTSSENHSSPKCKDENLSLCDKSFDVVLASDHLPAENSNEDCNIKSEPVNQKCLRTIAVSELQHSAVRSNSLPKIQTSSSVSGQEIRCVDTPMKEASDLGSKWNIDLQPSVRSLGASSSCGEGEKTAVHWDSSPEMQKNATYSRKILPVDDGSLDEKRILDLNDSGKDASKFEMDLVEDVSMRRVASERDLSSNEEVNKWQFSRKRPHIDLGETPLEDSTGTSQNVPWSSTNKYNTLADGDGHIKKLKTEISSMYGYEGSSRSDGYAQKICDLQYERPCDKEVILEDLGTAEQFFFPVGSQNGKGLQLGEKVPNLELALGGETKASNKGFLLPFLSERVEKQNKHGDLATIKEEEDVSASLSLSLSFPSPDRDETVKPTPKTGVLLPDMNTSLFLFGGFPDK